MSGYSVLVGNCVYHRAVCAEVLFTIREIKCADRHEMN